MGSCPTSRTIGKSVGNGVPVAGLAGKAELLNEFDTAGGHVLYAGTFNGNSVSMAAAIATLSEIESLVRISTRSFTPWGTACALASPR